MKRAPVLLLLVLLVAGPAGAAIHTVRNTEADGEGSLREAVEEAEEGDTIVFASDVRGTIAVDDPIEVFGTLTVRGPGADRVTLRGSGEIVVRSGGTVSISGLTISGGREATVTVERGRVTLLEVAVRDSGAAGVLVERGRLTLSRSLVAGNAGPGIESDGTTVRCINSTVADNGGAGVRATDGAVELASCTVAHNRGIGVQIEGASARLTNTLLAGNLRACHGAVTSAGHNLVDDESCAFAEPGDLHTQDVRLLPLAANGGPTATAALTGGSPAIDAGDPAGCSDPETGRVLSVDQRGIRRPAGPRCDIGAYEQPVARSGTVVDRILALVDGDPITSLELMQFANSDPRLAQAALADRAGVLDVLITQRILAKEVEAQGIVISDEEIDRYVANIRQRNNLTDEQLDAALAQQGMTRERYRAQIREELERAQLINREIRGKVSVSPEEIARFQQEQSGGDVSATAAEQVEISHIVLQIPPGASAEEVAAIEARAAALHAQLAAGANFAELARQESQDAAAAGGGKLGTFRAGEMRDELEAAVADLDPGEHSEPVRTDTAIHIIRLDARLGSDEQPELSDEAREEIKEQLYAKALEERYARWLKEDLRQRHVVEILP